MPKRIGGGMAAPRRTTIFAVLLQAGELDDAIVQFPEEIKIQPAFIEAYTNLGSALVRKGEPDTALAYFQKAAEMAKDSGTRPRESERTGQPRLDASDLSRQHDQKWSEGG